MDISINHHYLPKFFLKGFTDANDNFWVYDKLYDRIIPKIQNPSMRFYEKNSNTVTVEGNKIDIIEKAYQQIEDKVKGSIINSRSTDNLEGFEEVQNIAYLLIFTIYTFWRNPHNEEVNKSLLNFYNANKAKWDSLAKLSGMNNLTEDDKFKIAKLFVPLDLLREGKALDNKGKKTQFKIVDFKAPVFLISDNPILLPDIPIDVNDFQKSLILPISKSRALIFLESENYTYDEESIKMTNLLLINQATRYVAFHDRKMLENFVTGYKHLKKIEEHLDKVKKQLFGRINNKLTNSFTINNGR